MLIRQIIEKVVIYKTDELCVSREDMNDRRRNKKYEQGR